MYFYANQQIPMKEKKGIALIEDDPWLEPYEEEIQDRITRYKRALKEIKEHYGDLLTFATGHKYYGINFDEDQRGWFYREWAPEAYEVYLTGDFNDWDRRSHPLTRNNFGVWEIFLPYDLYQKRFVHKSKIKVQIVGANGTHDRIPAYITRVVQDTDTTDFSGQLWLPQKPFEWTDRDFNLRKIKNPIIYEAHVGMAQEKEGVGTYREFADKIVPRIRQMGYNSIQLMAVMEHPYYGSFGYHVSNFFAPSSRFGTPEDLKYLVDRAHKYGLAVIMDVVHSHAVKNLAEGLAEFDGSDHQYFHPGDRGYHTGWDSKLFDYGKLEVKRFLLSNLRYWLEEFHFDGFRFDGVTSMLYFDHGMKTFDNYDTYFKGGVDYDAVTYLQLANEVTHRYLKDAITIAEDVSGMPGLSRTIKDGGVGFDYRLAMGIPDFWIKYLKHLKDEEWNIYEMWNTLTNRRYKEKTIAYAESHDQAMVGDKTIAFWLMDKEMYFHMQVDDANPVIDRGIAVHKLLRMFTFALGGEGYLNFMGNEFGHPEWIDFPREGNGWSYQYARRQWSLVDNPRLKYQYLGAFDEAMMRLVRKTRLLASGPANQLNMDDDNKVVIFERNNMIFVFNFSVSNSVFGYKFKSFGPGTFEIVLNSDDIRFGGHGRVDDMVEYFTNEDGQLSIYTPSRSVLVFKKKEAVE
jgi:1,4-alpha-glucan branching enzyme